MYDVRCCIILDMSILNFYRHLILQLMQYLTLYILSCFKNPTTLNSNKLFLNKTYFTMKVNIKQEGGFIGMASKAKLDFSKLTDEEQKVLNDIADKAVAEKEAAAAPLPENAVVPPTDAVAPPPLSRGMNPAARDTFNYCLSMKKDGKKLDVAFDDTNAPPELLQLFQKYIKI
jgi:hypothetical protein